MFVYFQNYFEGRSDIYAPRIVKLSGITDCRVQWPKLELIDKLIKHFINQIQLEMDKHIWEHYCKLSKNCTIIGAPIPELETTDTLFSF